MISFDALEKERKQAKPGRELAKRAKQEREARLQERQARKVQKWWSVRCNSRQEERASAAANARQQILLINRLMAAKGGDFIVPGSATAKVVVEARRAGSSLDGPTSSAVLGLFLGALKVYGTDEPAKMKRSILPSSLGSKAAVMDTLGGCCSILAAFRWEESLHGRVFRRQCFASAGLDAVTFCCKIVR